MTVSSTINREQYATNGVTTAFTIHVAFFEDTDINAVFVDSGGSSTTLALNTDFTVSGGADADGVPAGGTLTTMGTLSPLASGGTLTLFREIPQTQDSDYVEDDPLPADQLESDLDRAVMRDQQLQDGQDRALTFPVTIDPGVSAELPTPEADAVLGWNSTADGLENKVLEPGTTVYASTANTNTGTATNEAVTPKGLHDSIYNSDDVTIVLQSGTVTTGTVKNYYRVLRKGTIEGVLGSLKTAQTSGSILTVDINVNGSTILSTKLTIANGQKTSLSATQPVFTSTALAVGDEVSFDVDQVGDGTAVMLEAGLKIRSEP